MSRGDQIKDAVGLLWTGLTGSKAEVWDKAEKIAVDVQGHVARARRPLNAPLEAHGEPVPSGDDDDDDAPAVEATAEPVCAVCNGPVEPPKRVCTACIRREGAR